jgi:antitoxin ParD1/3/4
MNISISLTPELVGLIKAKVDSGRYTSTSEVVREALRLLERADEREADSRARLRQAWEEDIASGDNGPLDFSELKAEARNKLPNPPYFIGRTRMGPLISGHISPLRRFSWRFRNFMDGRRGLSGLGELGGVRPVGQGAAGWNQRTMPPNSSASGQHEANAMRTREAVSVTRAATWIRRSRIVVNSADASGCGLGMASRNASISQ